MRCLTIGSFRVDDRVLLQNIAAIILSDKVDFTSVGVCFSSASRTFRTPSGSFYTVLTYFFEQDSDVFRTPI